MNDLILLAGTLGPDDKLVVVIPETADADFIGQAVRGLGEVLGPNRSVVMVCDGVQLAVLKPARPI